MEDSALLAAEVQRNGIAPETAGSNRQQREGGLKRDDVFGLFFCGKSTERLEIALINQGFIFEICLCVVSGLNKRNITVIGEIVRYED